MSGRFLLRALTVAALAGAGCARDAIERVEWTTMSTVAAVQGDGGVASVAAVATPVQAVFADFERLLDAHDPASELSRLAGLSDEAILSRCDASVRACYVEAFRLRDLSAGVFNPRWRGRGTMDLGAIAKGYAVDVAAAHVATTGVGRVLLDLGGNLKAVRGAWKVGIDGGGEFTLPEGAACATSGEYYRGSHIRDGRDGREVRSFVRSVTVVHPQSAMLADGLSTLLFILGREEGDAFLRRHFPESRAYWQSSPSP